jgi:hypothetical protein
MQREVRDETIEHVTVDLVVAQNLKLAFGLEQLGPGGPELLQGPQARDLVAYDGRL